MMAALLAALALGGCGAAATSTTSPQPLRGTPLLSIFEDEHLLHADPAGALATFQELGANVVRVYVAWTAIAPDPTSFARPAFDASDPAAYPAANWQIYDEIVRDAAARGIRVDLLVGAGGPLWATGHGIPRHGHSTFADAWMPSAKDYGAFVHALGVRYGGHYTPPGATSPLPRVDFWSIWNEPNNGVDLAPQAIDSSTVPVSPMYYRRLLDAAWTALASTGHTPATDTILFGETAPDGEIGPNVPDNFGGMVPLLFLQNLYCVNASFTPWRGSAATLRGCPATPSASARFEADNPALFEASGYAAHPYESQAAPTPTTSDPFDYANFSYIGSLEITLDRAAAAYGSRVQLPIYSTEFGYDKTYTPPAQGAVYMNEVEYLSWSNSRIRSYDQYLLVDPAASASFDTGLEDADGSPKATLAAYRMPLWMPVTTASHGTPLEVWGCARPAPYVQHVTHRVQQVEIQFAPTGESAYRTLLSVRLATSAGCYFDVRVRPPASGTIRLRWRGEGGHLYFSRVQAILLH